MFVCKYCINKCLNNKWVCSCHFKWVAGPTKASCCKSLGWSRTVLKWDWSNACWNLDLFLWSRALLVIDFRMLGKKKKKKRKVQNTGASLKARFLWHLVQQWLLKQVVRAFPSQGSDFPCRGVPTVEEWFCMRPFPEDISLQRGE